MAVSTRGAAAEEEGGGGAAGLRLAFNGQQRGASFGRGSSRGTPSWLFVMIQTLGWAGDKLLICLQCVSCRDAVQTFGISASNLPKMAPKLALSLGACPSGRRRLPLPLPLPLLLPLTLMLPLHTGGEGGKIC